LYELEKALEGGDTQFELVAIDACLMCSLETAQALAPYARFMVASEEEAAGYGSAFENWIHELYRNPGCGGGELGCEFCDATQQKYFEQSDALAEAQLTYSLIDLETIGEVSEGFDRLFDFAGKLYEAYPRKFNMFCNQLIGSETYGVGSADMVDLGSFLYNGNTVSLVDADIRNALIAALETAVYYNVKGSGRSHSKGLSICYSPDMTPEEMESYARNCHSAPYLALLDAVMPDWQAPDWVYEQARRLMPIEQHEDYNMKLELLEDGALPRLHILGGVGSMFSCAYNLYACDEDMNLIYALGDGEPLAEYSESLGDLCYVMDGSGCWPTIDGEPCCAELIDMEKDRYLFNVPVQIELDYSNLRLQGKLRYDAKLDRPVYGYEAVGLWPGYDEDTRMPKRAMISLQQFQGRQYRLIYPCFDVRGERQAYNRPGSYRTMYRGLEVEYAPLPAGVYYCGFTVTDIFRREYRTALVKLSWDGIKFRIAA